MYAYIFTNPDNIFYLTGYYSGSKSEREVIAVAISETKIHSATTGINAQSIDKIKLFLLTPQMFIKQVEEQTRQHEVKIYTLTRGQRFWDGLLEVCKSRFLICEAEDIRYNEYLSLRRFFKGKEVQISAQKGLLMQVRAVKSRSERSKIKKACELSERGFLDALRELKSGITELDFVAILENRMSKLSLTPAFPTIVAYAENSAIPHHKPGERKLKNNDIVLIDWGGSFQGYNSDMTSTFVYGKPNEQFINCFEKVEETFNLAISLANSGESIKTLAENASTVLGSEAKYMPHSLGHGIGISVHEDPHLSEFLPQQYPMQNLVAGNVITIEPGLYYKWGGVRLEKTVAILDGGREVYGNLSFRPKYSQLLS